jgi:hypothetical protein
VVGVGATAGLAKGPRETTDRMGDGDVRKIVDSHVNNDQTPHNVRRDGLAKDESFLRISGKEEER